MHNEAVSGGSRNIRRDVSRGLQEQTGRMVNIPMCVGAVDWQSGLKAKHIPEPFKAASK